MKKNIIELVCLATVVASCSGSQTQSSQFPDLEQNGKIAIVAHRGFWNCEAGGMSENSIASLKAAQDNGFWGSECDIHLAADGVVIVNHNPTIAEKKIAEHNYAEFAEDLLPNGEKRPTFDEYLAQAEKCRTTKIVVEFKPQPSDAQEDELVRKAVEQIKAHGLFTPERTVFISGSLHICSLIAEMAPEFILQFVKGQGARFAPDTLASIRINGFDYHKEAVLQNPQWVEDAHALGMSANAWIVDEEDIIRKLADLKIDAITSNDPLKVREIIGEAEFKL